ncbi:MAG: anti-sigma factor [Candidatus Binataceae bacterium]
MNCAEARRLLDGYADQELDLRTSIELEDHLGGCASCAREYEGIAALKSVLQERVPYYDAPGALRRRFRASARGAIRSGDKSSWWRQLGVTGWSWPVTAAVAAVFAAIVIRGVMPLAPPSGGALGAEVVDSHIRSMMANHLTDVLSSNQHTVKPWFDGKIDFAPSVKDLSAQGFPLAGGRLDFLDGRPVAALVYRHRLHIINLFTWPADHSPNSPPQLETRQGYNVVHWTQAGMEYWAVSDVAPADLESFAQLLRQGT